MLWSMPRIFFYLSFGLQKYFKESKFSDGFIYNLGKEILGEMLQNEIVHNIKIATFLGASIIFGNNLSDCF